MQSMLARDKISINEMSWILIKVFFGSSYLGFDVAVKVSHPTLRARNSSDLGSKQLADNMPKQISPLFGYTLMYVGQLWTPSTSSPLSSEDQRP